MQNFLVDLRIFMLSHKMQTCSKNIKTMLDYYFMVYLNMNYGIFLQLSKQIMFLLVLVKCNI